MKDKEKLLTALGAGFWILGLVLSIVGMNISSDAGSWMSVTGNILFLVGLGLEGICFYRRHKKNSAE